MRVCNPVGVQHTQCSFADSYIRSSKTSHCSCCSMCCALVLHWACIFRQSQLLPELVHNGLCWAAHTGLAIFYKPLAVPLWYCVITLLDVSGTKLSHNAMTETLTFVVHALFIGWFAICGTISFFVYVPFFPSRSSFFHSICCTPGCMCRVNGDKLYSA